MFYIIIGIIFIIVAIALVISALRSKKDKSFKLFNLKEDDYEITNRERFNSIMVAQDISVAIWIFMTGILCMLIKKSVIFLLPLISIIITIPFSLKGKKYIKIE